MASLDVLSLELTLGLHRVSVREWGKGEAKSSEDLFKEISEGESYLRINADGIARILQIVRFDITDNSHPGLFLLEDFQILPDGRRKPRNQRPAGKIGKDEAPDMAARRELKEELRLEASDFRIVPQDVLFETRSSRSFPGLVTVYQIHKFTVRLGTYITIENGYRVVDVKSGTQLFFRWGTP